MKAEQEKEERLIRWLEGDLSGKELISFEASPEFKEYNKIVETADLISYPKMDEDAVFKNIQDKISSSNQKTTKVIPLRRWIFAIAAVLILTFTIVSIIPKSITVTSDVGQFVAVSLPDGSEINLNGKSKIDYPKNFTSNRILQLEGEAFFDVTKGKSFVVKTDEGTISVLGTSFNIFAREDILIVSCKTGKVKVESKNNSFILEKGDEVRLKNENSTGKEFVDAAKIGTWINGESYFSRASLEEVILSLSSVYDTKIDLPLKYRNKTFTGSFVHNDIKKALKMVFSPMGIQYSIEDNNKVVISD